MWIIPLAIAGVAILSLIFQFIEGKLAYDYGEQTEFVDHEESCGD